MKKDQSNKYIKALNNNLKYIEMFYIIRNELNKIDPMGLFPGEGAPVDEYDPETSMVLAKLKNCIDYIELSQSISEIFSEMFGEIFTKDVFYDCAKNILEQVSNL